MEKQNNNVTWVRGKLIGRGSFGSVNLAYNDQTGAVFAVKSVDMNSTHQLVSLENEIEILRSLSSPHIVRYLGDDVSYDASCTTTYRNLHLEYLPRGAITNHIDADVDERTLRSYTWCIVSALDYLHRNGIVHCDVKGRNVLAGPTPGSAKLADFGSAVKIITCNDKNEKLVPRGSPLWMAPEVVRGEYQGPESDVWSLACTVIEIASNGKCHWWAAEGKEGDKFDLTHLMYSNDLPQIPTALSESGRDFLEKCLRRNPKDRWSCDQLLQHPFLAMRDWEFNCDYVINATYNSSSFWIRSSAELSPHSVLDRHLSGSGPGFGGREDGDEGCSSASQATVGFGDSKVSAKGRIGKLAGDEGAIWESKGWVTVRSCGYEEKQELVVEEIRTNSECTVSDRRAKWEIHKICGGDGSWKDYLAVEDGEKGVGGFVVVNFRQLSCQLLRFMLFLLLYLLQRLVTSMILRNEIFTSVIDFGFSFSELNCYFTQYKFH